MRLQTLPEHVQTECVVSDITTLEVSCGVERNVKIQTEFRCQLLIRAEIQADGHPVSRVLDVGRRSALHSRYSSRSACLLPCAHACVPARVPDARRRFGDGGECCDWCDCCDWQRSAPKSTMFTSLEFNEAVAAVTAVTAVAAVTGRVRRPRARASKRLTR
jgi:hypothetical protein